MEANVELITPLRAQEYLKNLGKQRPLSEKHVKRLAEKMNAGIWAQTGEPIQFDTNGHLANGQHRLAAIVRSGREQRMLVVRGVAPEAFAKMDQGKKRSAGDVLAIAGLANYNQGAVAVRLLVNLRDEGGIKRNSLDNSIIEKFATENMEDLQEALTLALRCRDVVPAGVMAALLFMTLQVSRAMTVDFANQLATGANLSPRSPVLCLRNKLIATKSRVASRALHPEHIFGYLVSAWNHFYENKEIARLNAAPSLLPKGFRGSFWNR